MLKAAASSMIVEGLLVAFGESAKKAPSFIKAAGFIVVTGIVDRLTERAGILETTVVLTLLTLLALLLLRLDLFLFVPEPDFLVDDDDVLLFVGVCGLLPLTSLLLLLLLLPLWFFCDKDKASEDWEDLRKGTGPGKAGSKS